MARRDRRFLLLILVVLLRLGSHPFADHQLRKRDDGTVLDGLIYLFTQISASKLFSTRNRSDHLFAFTASIIADVVGSRLDRGEQDSELIEIILAPLVKWMLVALGALDP